MNRKPNLSELAHDQLPGPLSVLGAADLRNLDARVRVIHRTPGNIIYEEGESAIACFFVAQGRLEVFQHLEDGEQLTLQLSKPGDLLGVDEILTNHRVHRSSTRVLEESLLVEIPCEEILDLLKTSTEFCFEVSRWLANQTLAMIKKVDWFYDKSAAERLSETLAELAEAHGVSLNGNGAVEIPLPLSNRELAGLVGTTPQTISTLLGPLKKQAILSRRGETIVIQHPERLRPRPSKS